MWLSTWPGAEMPVEHDTEAAAAAHATELVRSGRAQVATFFEVDMEDSQ
jgi:hypothetical protein